MKFRQDFVTNSSSTSFIISLKDEWNENNFFKSIGLLDDSAMREIFIELFRAIENNKKEIIEYIKEHYPEDKTVSIFLANRNFSNDVIEKISQLMQNGRIIYYGELSTENGDIVESFFATESFLVCEDDIYFNGQSAVW